MGPDDRLQALPVGREDSEAAEADTQLVSAVVRAISVLDAFRPSDGPLGNAELAERTGLTKPTVSRLTYTLARSGYLRFDPRYRVYELGPSAVALGNVAIETVDVRRIARPLMQRLAYHANFNVGLGTRDGTNMVYTDAFEGDALVGLTLRAGSRLPLATSAMGRAYFAALGEAERSALLEELRPRYEEAWDKVVDGLISAVADYREDGFCSSLGDWQRDIVGVAAAINVPGSATLYVVNLGGPAYLLPKKQLLDELGPKVAELARTVSTTIMPAPPAYARR